jgi:hypothetical protein
MLVPERSPNGRRSGQGREDVDTRRGDVRLGQEPDRRRAAGAEVGDRRRGIDHRACPVAHGDLQLPVLARERPELLTCLARHEEHRHRRVAARLAEREPAVVDDDETPTAPAALAFAALRT